MLLMLLFFLLLNSTHKTFFINLSVITLKKNFQCWVFPHDNSHVCTPELGGRKTLPSHFFPWFSSRIVCFVCRELLSKFKVCARFLNVITYASFVNVCDLMLNVCAPSLHTHTNKEKLIDITKILLHNFCGGQCLFVQVYASMFSVYAATPKVVVPRNSCKIANLSATRRMRELSRKNWFPRFSYLKSFFV